ncbi:AAA family ATPase [Bacillus toyonensis]|uniref:AAA family ATPase n=1 Tax=Bacillus toyonensis TaxID=155322 RepID=UPI000BF6E224|nr:SMC family ATPase [Bacillus toyonensis]PGD17960.1 hypothetical protein COM35_04930 [Bacillus toyonensis]
MNLKAISIQNFRNYKGKHEFHLNDKINILYGNNGNGKSSFFDAIEWCLTGAISRFIKKDKQAIANKHIGLGEECSVQIFFSTYCIRRIFNKTENGFGNDSFTLNKVEDDILTIRIATGIDNVNIALQKIFQEQGIKLGNPNYKFTDVLKKAYILSQDQVVDFVIRDKGTERYNSLASIMGFEKIVEIRKTINNSKKFLERSYKELDSEIVSIHENIDRELSKKRRIDYREYEKIEEQIGKDISTEQIKVLDSKFRRELYKNENRLEVLQNIFDKGFKNATELEMFLHNKDIEIFDIEQSIHDSQIQMKNEEELIYRHQLTLRDWSENEKLRQELQNHIKSIKERKKELSQLNIPGDNLTLDSLKEKRDLKEEELSRFEFALKNKKGFDDTNNFLLNFNDIFAEKKEEFIKYNEKLKEFTKQEEALRDQIVHADKDSGLSKLINNIEDILEFLARYNTNGICPVCTSDVGEHLQVKIDRNMQRIISSVNEDKDNLKRLLEDKKKYNKEIEWLNHQMKLLQNTLDELERKKEISIKDMDFIKNHKLFTKIFDQNYEWIEEQSYLLKQELDNVDLAIKYLREIEEKQNTLKEYNVFDKEGLVPDNSVESIQKALDLELQKIEMIKKEVIKQTNELDKNKKIKIENEILLKELQNIIQDIGDVILEEAIIQTNKYIKLVNLRISMIEKSRGLLEIERYNKEINQEIDRLHNQKLMIEERRMKLQKKIRMFNDLIGKLDKEFGEGTADFLNNNESSIQRYFRYLNPKPSEYSQLYFDINKNEQEQQELAIKILDENSNAYKVDANMALSSGQLNVLALSIFIATNEAQVNSYFDFIAIDDPIQNMDDLNRFSICDVLGGLNKQLIFSTHDQEFIRLFLKKNEHKKDNVSVFVLSSDEQKYKILEI